MGSWVLEPFEPEFMQRALIAGMLAVVAGGVATGAAYAQPQISAVGFAATDLSADGTTVVGVLNSAQSYVRWIRSTSQTLPLSADEPPAESGASACEVTASSCAADVSGCAGESPTSSSSASVSPAVCAPATNSDSSAMSCANVVA